MTNNNSLTWIDQLATETILEIFEYLSTNDIIYAFFHFNQRFNSILLQHQQFFKTFQILKTNLDFWKDILPIIVSHIQHLIITTNDFWFSIDLFPNLKSIIISSTFPIHEDQIDLMMKTKQFKNIISFKIQSKLCYEIKKHEESGRILLENIFNNNNSLQTFEYLINIPWNNFQNFYNFKKNTNIRSLSLNLKDLTSAFYLLRYTPNIKYLNLIVISIGYFPQFNYIFDSFNIKLEKLYFTYEIGRDHSSMNERDFLTLTNFIKQFSSSLTCLSINLSRICIRKTNTFQFNGILLQQQLLESMLQLKIFHLYAQFQDKVNIKKILSTFRNQFWFDHNWSIGMHGRYLYTLPFYFDQLEEFVDFKDIKSNNSTIYNSSQTWHCITSINLSVDRYLNSNLRKQMRIKMPNLTSIKLTSFSSQYPECTDENIKNEIDKTLNNITTVQCSFELLLNLQPWFIYILRNVKRLVFYYSRQFFDSAHSEAIFFESIGLLSRNEWRKVNYSHFSRIQDVEIKFIILPKDDLCTELTCVVKHVLKIFANSNIFLFHFYQINDFIFDKPYTYLDEMITSLNRNENLENYQMEQSYNYLQLTKK